MIRHIVVKDDLVFIGNRSFEIDCSVLLIDSVVFVGEDITGIWIEKEPFTGRIYDYDMTVALDLLSQAQNTKDTTAHKLSIEKIKEQKKQEVNKIRYEKIYAGSIPYTFPGDTKQDGIKISNEKDRQDIQDFVIDAILKDPNTKMEIMSTSNKVKTITAAHAIEMWQYFKSIADKIAKYSWLLQDKIMAAESIEALNSINIKDGWPVW